MSNAVTCCRAKPQEPAENFAGFRMGHRPSLADSRHERNSAVQRPDTNQTGTLLWIGDRTSPSFARPFEFCEQTAAQIAHRTSLSEAVGRPASEVRWIVVSRLTLAPMNSQALQSLARQHPTARRINLLGPACAGGCRAASHREVESSDEAAFFGPDRHYWHRWNQVLPGFLDRDDAKPSHWQLPNAAESDEPSIASSGATSLVVMAARFGAARPLVDLAASTGATVAWSPGPGPTSIRNVDVVWWDDSIATPAATDHWKKRLSELSTITRPHQTGPHQTGPPIQAWITNSARYEDHQRAREAGIDMVITKPLRIAPLVHMLAPAAGHKADLRRVRIAPAETAA